ncbi:MAG: VIT1/CCC1 transporter family protein [Bacteroidota bacterium]|jgi:VIT1/CCC1 family predicted Fe2+/Mn2+ transporter
MSNHVIHHETHFRQPDFVKDVVIGMSDGLTVPFALAAGLSGVLQSNVLIITGGLAEICAGSIAMGLGGYLAGRTEIEHYRNELKREYREIETRFEDEKQEVRDVFAGYGLSQKSQDMIADELSKDHTKWVEFMMRFELGLEKPDEKRAGKSALNIGLAYVIGGVVPLLGYFFTEKPEQGLFVSTIITLVCLFFFGFLKSKVTGHPPLIGALRITFIGALAGGSAYILAKLVA